MTEEELLEIIFRCIRKVHSELGPGLYESVYELALLKELTDEGIECKNQVSIPFLYKDVPMNKIFRADIFIEKVIEGLIVTQDEDFYKKILKIIIEIKSSEIISNLNKQQVQTYLKLTSIKYGVLVNFNVINIDNNIILIRNLS